jgi:PAS domain S-box-containing protein
MSDRFLVIDEAGVIECASAAAARMFGYAVPELDGLPVRTLLEIPEQPAVVAPPFTWMDASPHPILDGIHRNGRRVPLRLTQKEIHGAGATHVVVFLQDPAEPIAEDVFLHHKELYELATWHGRISVWEVDYRTNNFEFSAVLGQLLGLTAEQIPTTVEGWARHFHPDDWKLIEREAERMLRREIPEMNVETRMLHADGSILWSMTRGKAFFDEAGRPIRALGTTVDITERKRAELERDLFFTLSLDLLCIADTRGFRRVNPAFCRTLGYTEAELTSRPFLDFVHPDDLEATQKVVAKLQQGENLIHFENRYRCKDGSYRWLSWRCPAPSADSEWIHAVARDVTEAKQVQAELERAKKEAEDANRAKSDFLSRMSHELRTPLNAILGFGQLLQRDALTEKQRQEVDLIVKGGRHLLGLINEVLDISRIEVGRLDLSPEAVALPDLLREVAHLTQPMAAEHGVMVFIDDPSVAGKVVLADLQRLKQVLLNLVSNAIKYNKDLGRVRIHAEPVPPGRLRIHVSDTGPGIALDKQARLFTPFDRLGAESTPIEGSGLGLVLSKRLVEIMGGTLTFVSKLGQGTRFTVELARGHTDHAPGADMPISQARPSPAPAAARTVLYIEDNAANTQLLQAVLMHRPGLRLLTAAQGGAGIELARQHLPDLILLDVHLPDMKGPEMMARLSADAALRSIPVIVISADATAHQIERLLAIGAREYLTKPIDVDQLLRVVDRYLG